MPRFSSSKAVTARCLGRCLVQKSSLRLFYKHAGRLTALVAILSLHFSLTNYPVYPPSSSVNNDFVEVDELIFEIADYKNAMPMWPPKNFLGSARPVGELINTCEIASTMPGYPTTHVSRCDELSSGYKCRYIRAANTGGRMSSRERTYSPGQISQAGHVQRGSVGI
jgi:hypothetical protein